MKIKKSNHFKRKVKYPLLDSKEQFQERTFWKPLKKQCEKYKTENL